jgi:cytochrome P450
MDVGSEYWGVFRHADVVEVSRHPDVYCSGLGIAFEDVPPELMQMANSFLAMDDPDHKRIRALAYSAFGARQVKRIDAQIELRAKQVIDELLQTGDCDFVEHVAMVLPMRTLWDTWGIPEEERAPLVIAADEMVGKTDPQIARGRPAAEVMWTGLTTLRDYSAEYAARKRRSPGEDLMSSLVQAEIEGTRLTDDEIGAFFVLLAVAGLDTTRHTASYAIKALTDFPDQRRLLMEDLTGRLDTAVDEFIRWASPVMNFRRTTTRDTELAGQPIAEGEKVVMFYSSANRDELAFEHPEQFDILRSPNRHVGFGGGGPHFCLGNQLARTQLKALFSELLTRVPEIQAAEPEYVDSAFIQGILRLPCTIGTPA